MAQREPKQSQLDYLWVNFGEYSVSTSTVNGNIPPNTIPSAELVAKLLDTLKDEALSNLEVVGSKLIGRGLNGNIIFSIDISEIVSGGNSIVGFGKRYIEEDEGSQFEPGTPVYYIELSDGNQLVTPIEGGTYNGSETNTVVVTIEGESISADVKLDGDSLIKSSKGLKVNPDKYYTKDEINDKLNWNNLT